MNMDELYLQYEEYLKEHKNNLILGFEWLREKFGETLFDNDTWNKADHNVRFAHDSSKNNKEEYDAYTLYFYGGNRSYEVVENFQKAWLHHLHNNPHHWQHWVLINDDKGEGQKALDIPNEYILEMICDWWSFSWKTDKLEEIFDWYKQREEHIIFSEKTKNTVKNILELMNNELNNDNVND